MLLSSKSSFLSYLDWHTLIIYVNGLEQTLFHFKTAKTKEFDIKEINPLSKLKCTDFNNSNVSNVNEQK